MRRINNKLPFSRLEPKTFSILNIVLFHDPSSRRLKRLPVRKKKGLESKRYIR